MTTPTSDEYDEACKLLKMYKRCDYCHKIFPSKDNVHTTYYGQEKDWCPVCWPKVKDD